MLTLRSLTSSFWSTGGNGTGGPRRVEERAGAMGLARRCQLSVYSGGSESLSSPVWRTLSGVLTAFDKKLLRHYMLYFANTLISSAGVLRPSPTLFIRKFAAPTKPEILVAKYESRPACGPWILEENESRPLAAMIIRHYKIAKKCCLLTAFFHRKEFLSLLYGGCATCTEALFC